MRATPERADGTQQNAVPRRGVPAEATPRGNSPGVQRLLWLQRRAGNAAVARLVGRSRDPGSVPGGTEPVPEPPVESSGDEAVQRQSGRVGAAPPGAPPDPGEPRPPVQRLTAEELIDKHSSLLGLDEAALGQELARRAPGEPGLVLFVLARLSSSDRDDVSHELVKGLGLGGLGGVREDLRMRLLEQMVTGWVTGEEEAQISRIWSSFGTQLPAVAARNMGLWKKSVEESDQVNELPAVVTAREAFPADVINLARAYLKDNKRGVMKEAQRLGLDIGGGQGVDPALAQPGYLEGIKAIGVQVMKLDEKLMALRRIQVGYSTYRDVLSGAPMGDVPARFDPENEPEKGPDPHETATMPSWDVTKKQYDRVDAVVRGFANLYPSIYVLIREGKLETLTKAGSAAQAGVVLADSLRHSRAKIEQAEGMLGGSIAFYDLVPLHQQLLSGSAGLGFASQRRWQDPFFSMLAKDVLADHESREFWVSLGLSLAGAAALVAVPFTAGASGAFLVGFGLGIGAAQAGMSWQRYQQLATAADAGVRDDLKLVAGGQVSTALVAAVLDTVSLFLDAYGAAGSAAAHGAARRAAFKDADDALRKRMLREAGQDAAMTLAGAGAAIAGHELFEQDPPIAAAGSGFEFDLPRPAVNRLSVQRDELAALLGKEFEKYVDGGLRRNEIAGVPRMDFVIPGEYNAQGHGIDRIGISIDPASGHVGLYHFEMKYQLDPKLGRPTVGTQTGAAWTRKAIDGLVASKHPKARAAMDQLRTAVQLINKVPYADDTMVRAFLHGRLATARPIIFVPDGANLTRLWRQVAALFRWGRGAQIVKVTIPK